MEFARSCLGEQPSTAEGHRNPRIRDFVRRECGNPAEDTSASLEGPNLGVENHMGRLFGVHAVLCYSERQHRKHRQHRRQHYVADGR